MSALYRHHFDEIRAIAAVGGVDVYPSVYAIGTVISHFGIATWLVCAIILNALIPEVTVRCRMTDSLAIFAIYA